MKALLSSINYYASEPSARAYFEKIREQRGAKGPYQDLIDWEKDFPKDASVLEVGFGPGIEFEYLVSKNYPRLDGLDLSPTMKVLLEKELDAKFGASWRERANLYYGPLQEFGAGLETYDRIWAQATFLHLDKSEMASSLQKYVNALKSGGEIFLSFKVGEGPTKEDAEGRPFSHYTEESFRLEVFANLKNVELKKMWIPETGDILNRAHVRWLNIILRRL